MSFLAKTIVKVMFTFTSKERAKKQAYRALERYLLLNGSISEELANIQVMVPKMSGVDEDMRNWSFNMLLEHNTIVNNSISALVYQLSTGDELHGDALIDPKKDVMPSQNPPSNQIKLFEESIRQHFETVEQIPSLHGTKKVAHPLFGDFDAHMWHCMFAFHLKVHVKQAKYIIEHAKKEKGLI